MSVVDLPDSPINKITVTTKKGSKPVKMNNRPKIELPKKIIDEIKLTQEVPDELKHGAKSMVVKAMSIPAKSCAPIFYQKLNQSKFINKYLDQYLMIDYIADLNDHIKFGLCYLYNLFESKMIEQHLNQLSPVNNIDEQSTKTTKQTANSG